MFEVFNKNYTVVDISEDNRVNFVRVPNEVAEYIDRIKLNNAELRSKINQLEKANKYLEKELNSIKIAMSSPSPWNSRKEN